VRRITVQYPHRTCGSLLAELDDQGDAGEGAAAGG
jgi:hypothetical protein